METGRIGFVRPIDKNITTEASTTEAAINIIISVINTTDTIYTTPGEYCNTK